MSSARHWICSVFCAVQFALVGLVCTHETLWLLERNLTIIPAGWDSLWRSIDRAPSLILADWKGADPIWRTIVAGYISGAGIEAGYGYFAPNVPLPHALIFECKYRDGHFDYQSPVVADAAAHLRLTTLIEQVARIDDAKWREELIRLLARSTWKRHPEIVSIRALFGSISSPTAAEYRAGKTEHTFTCQYIYSLALPRPEAAGATP